MGFGGRGGKGGKGGGRGFGRGSYDEGPPETVQEMGTFQHPCEGEIVVKSSNTKIPYFNAPIYLENKSEIGKVDEIFGSIQEVYFSVKAANGISATSFKTGDKLFINPLKLLPLERFLPQPKGSGGAPGGGRGKGGKGGGKGGKGMKGRGSPGKGKGSPGKGSPGGRGFGKGGRGRGG